MWHRGVSFRPVCHRQKAMATSAFLHENAGGGLHGQKHPGPTGLMQMHQGQDVLLQQRKNHARCW